MARITADKFHILAKPEFFLKGSNPQLPFYEREAKEAPEERDDLLGDKSFFVLKTREPFRLRLSITYGEGTEMPSHNVQSIRIKMKDRGDSVDVPYEVVSSDGMLEEIIVSVDPVAINSDALMTASRVHGRLEEKYEKMEVLVDFNIDNLGSAALRKRHDLYLMLTDSGAVLMYYVTKSWLLDEFAKLPRFARSFLDAIVGFFIKSGKFAAYLSPFFAAAGSGFLHCCCCT